MQGCNWSRSCILHYSSRNFRRALGASLIEMLVVFAVLAVLAGIMFPVFTVSKSFAQRSKCAHNLMILGRAFIMYADDWNGVFPSPGGLKGDWGYWSQFGLGGLAKYVGPSSKSLQTVWCCPELTDWTGIYPPRSYGMNSYLREPMDVDYPSCTGILKGIRVSDIPKPRRTILLYEGLPELKKNRIDYVKRCANWEWVRGWFTKPANSYFLAHRPWHGNRNNYLYCDGHVRSRRPECYSDTPNHFPPIDENNEWYVDPIAKARRLAKGR